MRYNKYGRFEESPSTLNVASHTGSPAFGGVSTVLFLELGGAALHWISIPFGWSS